LKKMQATRGGVAPATVRPPIGAHVGEPTADPLPPPPPRATRVVNITREQLRAAGVLAPEDEERQLVQQFRQIKRPLVANALGRGTPQLPNGQLIMLASALPGGGKTFTSVNLALSLAMEKDVRILLVDADVAKPHISKIFGVEGEPGLLDVLRDEHVDVDSVIMSTDVPGLSILPAGRASDTATELLASSRMGAVITQLGARDAMRIVLFDSPPLLLTTEARALAGQVGQIVLVVAAGVTPQQAVLDALELLGEGKSIGLVLNQSEEGGQTGYHRYYGSGTASNENEKEGG